VIPAVQQVSPPSSAGIPLESWRPAHVAKHGQRVDKRTGGSQKPKVRSRDSSRARKEVAAVVPKKVIKPVTDIAGWANAREVYLSAKEPNRTFLERLGWPLHFADHYSVSEHGVSHVSRELALQHVIALEGVAKQELKVFDWFGSPRSEKLNPASSPPYLKMENGQETKQGLQVQFVAVPGTAIAGDVARGFTRRDFEDKENADIAIVFDVYFLTPEDVLSLCKRTTTGRVYLLFRAFFGEAGADVIGPEGAWVRDENGNILFSSHPGAMFYTPHPDINWAFSRAYDGLDFADVARFGPYHLVRATCSVPGAIPLLSVSCDTAKIVKWNQPTWWDSFVTLLPAVVKYMVKSNKDKGMLVHLPIAHELSGYRNRQPSGFNWDTCIVKVNSALDKDAELVHLLNRFPALRSRLVNGTVMHVMFTGKEDVIDTMVAMRARTALAEHALFAVRSNEPTALSVLDRLRYLIRGRGWTTMMACVAILAGYSQLRRMARVLWVVLLNGKDKVLQAVLAMMAKWTTASAGKVLAFVVNKFSGLWSKMLGIFCTPFGVTKLSPIFEEIVKMAWPRASIGIFAFEFLINASRSSVAAATPAFFLHAATLGCNIFHRGSSDRTKALLLFCNVFVHAFFNGLVQHARDTQGITYLPTDTEVLPTTNPTLVAPKIEGEMEIRVDGELVTAEQALELLSNPPTATNRIFPVLITGSSLLQPANNEKNLLVALLYRLHKPTGLRELYDAFPMPERHRLTYDECRDVAWDEVALMFAQVQLVPLPVDAETTWSEVRKKMGSRANRIMKAASALEQGETDCRGKEISLKWNETITQFKEFDDCVSIRPRAITNLHPSYHAACALISRDITKYFKALFYGLTIASQSSGKIMRLWYAAGYDAAGLDEIYRQIQGSTYVEVLACGDDTYVRMPDGTVNPYDVAMMDQCHSEASMGFYMGLLKLIGVPEDIRELLWEQCSCPYTICKGRLSVRGTAPFQLPTGFVQTTTCNTVQILMVFAFWHWTECDITIGMAAQSLGFKITDSEHINEVADFLKGWWVPAEEGMVWLPLPSAVIKLGKVMKNPIHMGMKRIKGKKIRPPYHVAIAEVATEIALSLGHIPDNYPILGQLTKQLRFLGVVSDKTMTGLSESVKPVRSPVNIRRSAVIAMMEIRYGLTEAEIVQAELLIEKVQRLPAQVSHVVFDTLADVDYGTAFRQRQVMAASVPIALSGDITKHVTLKQKLMSIVPFSGRRHAGRGDSTTMSVLSSAVTKGVAKAVASSIDYGAIGKNVRGLIEGYRSSSAPGHKSKSMDAPSYSAPVAISSRQAGRRASIRSGKRGKPTIVAHRELIADTVNGSTTFGVAKTFSINPGLATTFPWLSTQATQYEEYRFRSLKFEWVPIAPTSTQGVVVLMTEFDPTRSAPTRETHAVDHPNSITDSVWKNINMVCSPRDMHAVNPRKFVRTAATYGDIKTYDVGTFYCCTNNFTGTSAIGKLYVSYVVEFSTPTIGPLDGLASTSTSLFAKAAAQTITNNLLTPVLFDATAYMNPLAVAYDGVQYFTPPAGYYRIKCVINPTDNTAETFAGNLSVYKSGAGIAGSGSNNANFKLAAVAGCNTLLEVEAFVFCNGTDTIAFYVTLLGAAGTLSLVAGGTQVTFSIV